MTWRQIRDSKEADAAANKVAILEQHQADSSSTMRANDGKECSTTGRKRGRPLGKSSRPYGFYKGMTPAEIRKSKAADAAVKAAAEHKEQESEQDLVPRDGIVQQERPHLELEGQDMKQPEAIHTRFEQGERISIETNWSETGLQDLDQPSAIDIRTDAVDDSFWSLPIHLPGNRLETELTRNDQWIIAPSGFEQEDLTLPSAEIQDRSMTEPGLIVSGEDYESPSIHLPSTDPISSRPTTLIDDADSASSPSRWSESTDVTIYDEPPQTPRGKFLRSFITSYNEIQDIYTRAMEPVGGEYPNIYSLVCMTCRDWTYQYGETHFPRGKAKHLRGCTDKICLSCMTERYASSGSSDSCGTCPECHVFVGFIDPACPLGPALILDMLSKIRALPAEHFSS